MAALLLFCLAGALWTAYWSVRFGLAPRPPLSVFQTTIRIVLVMTALLLLWKRRDPIERIALACAVIGGGSSALYGLGFNSATLQVMRLLFHFLGYSIGSVAIVRWFRSNSRGAQVKSKFASREIAEGIR